MLFCQNQTNPDSTQVGFKLTHTLQLKRQPKPIKPRYNIIKHLKITIGVLL